MRQKVTGLVHQVDAHVFVVDANVDVHAGDQHAPGNAAKSLLKLVVAGFVCVVRVLPVGERVAGNRDGGEAVLGGLFGDTGSKSFEVFASFPDGCADLCADFDLAGFELGAELALKA